MSVTFCWVVSIIAGVVLGDYQPALYTTPLMGAVVGYVTGVRLWKNGKNGDGA